MKKDLLKSFYFVGSHTACFASLMLLGIPVMAQRSAVSQRCSFNGVNEICDLSEIRKNGKWSGTTIRWKSDSKLVDYYFSDCNGDHGYTYCKVEIIEDNGRITYGNSEHGGRGTIITSSRGNKTWYPPF